MNAPVFAFEIGEHVEKFGGDYHAKGVVISCFWIVPDSQTYPRYVVRHRAEGGGYFCHIYSEQNLRSIDRTVIHVENPEAQAPVEQAQQAQRPPQDQGAVTHGPSVEELQKGHRHEETMTQKELSRSQGYTGDLCVHCSNFTMKRNGPCLVCETCGHTTGCN
jgi:hypothetical protein